MSTNTNSLSKTVRKLLSRRPNGLTIGEIEALIEKRDLWSTEADTPLYTMIRNRLTKAGYKSQKTSRGVVWTAV